VNSAKSPFNLVVPDDLAERDQWILWRRETSDGRETKVPYSVEGRKASSTNPLDWAGLEKARDAWRRNRQSYTGLGFVFSSEDPFVGIDLDDCLNTDGTPKQWQAASLSASLTHTSRFHQADKGSRFGRRVGCQRTCLVCTWATDKSKCTTGRGISLLLVEPSEEKFFR